MRNKNWIEFNNEEILNENNDIEILLDHSSSKINIFKQKKGKKGKIITLIKGLPLKDDFKLNKLLKDLKKYCGTGGKLAEEYIQLQGDMVKMASEFLRKDGYQI